MTMPHANKLLPPLLTIMALSAFAANSVLCRLALGDNTIDPASFTVARLISGALALWVIVMLRSNKTPLVATENHPTQSFNQPQKSSRRRSWLAPTMLFIYAISFSFAYVSLDTATGALILFATVQFSMLGISLLQGAKLRVIEWVGAAISLSGFVFLMLPGVTQPSLYGFILMMISGLAWAVYTLEGKRSEQPVYNTAVNFWRSMPFALALLLIALLYLPITLSKQGILLAIASGVLASALGYTLWYSALRYLTVTLAALSQLTVPLIAAIGGILWVGEQLTANLVLSGLLILGGIFLVIIRPGVKA